MIRSVCFALSLSAASELHADEFKDLKKELAELKRDYSQRIESLETRLTQLAAAQAKAGDVGRRLTEVVTRTEIKALETERRVEEAHDLIQQNRSAIERFSATVLLVNSIATRLRNPNEELSSLLMSGQSAGNNAGQ
jgi:hypothetical protein